MSHWVDLHGTGRTTAPDGVTDALNAARATRGSLAGAVFHSDHGSVYTLQGLRPTVPRPGGDPVHGCGRHERRQQPRESFNATLKREVLQDHNAWPDEATCRRQVFRWLVRYNTRRRHSWCRYQSPVAYETGHTAATLPSAA